MMKSCIDYLREVESTKGWTPYRISKEVGLTSQRVYQLFSDGGTYNDETAYKVAQILGEDPLKVIAAAHAEREKNPELKATWQALVEKISKGFEILISCANPRQCLSAT